MHLPDTTRSLVSPTFVQELTTLPIPVGSLGPSMGYDVCLHLLISPRGLGVGDEHLASGSYVGQVWECHLVYFLSLTAIPTSCPWSLSRTEGF